MKKLFYANVFQSRSPTWSRVPIAGLVCAAALLVGVALAWAQGFRRIDVRSAAADRAAKADTDRPNVGGQIREGTEIADQAGYFRVTDDRVTFFLHDGKQQFVVLENLNLDRIAQVLAEDGEQFSWSVTGTITEFRGANFLLVRRAVVRSQAGGRPDGRTTNRLTAIPSNGL